MSCASVRKFIKLFSIPVMNKWNLKPKVQKPFILASQNEILRCEPSKIYLKTEHEEILMKDTFLRF